MVSPETAVAIGERLGERSAGVYQNESGAMVVTVDSEASARQVRAWGAAPKVVAHTADELAEVKNAVRAAAVSGMLWAVDVPNNQVLVSLDSTVTPAAEARLRERIKAYGDAVRVERSSNELRLAAAGGDAIFTVRNSRCSLGFNVRLSDGQAAFLTAGHCTGSGKALWGDANGTLLGVRLNSVYGPDDWAVVQYANNNVARPGSVNMKDGTLRDIANAGDAWVGQVVTRVGSTTGKRQGTVAVVDAEMKVGGVLVDNLVVTNACAEPGDSGGPLFAGNTALGLLSGLKGTCSDPIGPGRYTVYQPVKEALAKTGTTIY
ncbi:S1 family peptidase [Actinoplanes sp. NPDC023936]|uniref:S1 family peptidase n=1 Tax=Actinoplanes sp. NPDC023936 TaxID=3154910 RepID=UPI0033DCA353